MLTAFQRRLLEIIGALPEATDFALAGGAALIAAGVVDRRNDDLDLFIDHRTMPEAAVTEVWRRELGRGIADDRSLEM